MAEPFIRGRLGEDGERMVFPALENGVLKPVYGAIYHIHTKPQADYNAFGNLIYLALPSGVTLELGPREVSVPFRQKGQITDVKRFRVGPSEITTDGTTLAKIHPGTPYKIKAKDGTPYHYFEWLKTPEQYRNPEERMFDFVYQDEGKGLAFIERGDRIVVLPGVLLFSENSAFRKPGWLAKWFNGSPEFGFAYSPFKEPDKNEALHYHQRVMEPYMGADGVARLFLAIQEGSDNLDFVNREGRQETVRGEILELRKGDVVIPMPEIKHKLVFDTVPFTIFCVNYTDGTLTKDIDDTDKVPVENVKAVRNPSGLGAV